MQSIFIYIPDEKKYKIHHKIIHKWRVRTDIRLTKESRRVKKGYKQISLARTGLRVTEELKKGYRQISYVNSDGGAKKSYRQISCLCCPINGKGIIERRLDELGPKRSLINVLSMTQCYVRNQDEYPRSIILVCMYN